MTTTPTPTLRPAAGEPTPSTATRSPSCRQAAADETGSVSLFLVVAVLALFAVFGLVVDGGSCLDGQRRVTDTAEQAARAAAQAVDPTALRTGTGLRLDSTAARRAAATYLATTPGMTLTGLVIDQTGVTVTVTTVVHPQVLSVAGIGTLTVTGTGHAQLLTPPDNVHHRRCDQPRRQRHEPPMSTPPTAKQPAAGRHTTVVTIRRADRLRGLAALLLLAVIVIGVPALLLALTGRPFAGGASGLAPDGHPDHSTRRRVAAARHPHPVDMDRMAILHGRHHPRTHLDGSGPARPHPARPRRPASTQPAGW